MNNPRVCGIDYFSCKLTVIPCAGRPAFAIPYADINNDIFRRTCFFRPRYAKSRASFK